MNNMSTLQQLQSVEDYFPLLLEQTLQIYALRMKENEDQADTVVSNTNMKLYKLNLSYENIKSIQ